MVYTEDNAREIHVLFNGKNTGKSMLLKGYRCEGPCLKPVINDTVVIEDTARRWSNPLSWESKKVPVAGESVEILPGVNMLYDVAESPIMEMITINGRLTFEDGKTDLHLRAKYIFVRVGELIIGTAD